MNPIISAIIAMTSTFLMCFFLLLLFIRYKKNMLHQAVSFKEKEIEYQRSLINAVVISQEEEAKRIGMELHDAVGSDLSSLRLIMDAALSDTGDTDNNAYNLAKSKQVLDKIIKDVRHISHDLSPFKKGAYEFYDAVYDYIENINDTGKLVITIEDNDSSEGAYLIDLVALNVYRVITELLNNTMKHASATRVNINFKFEDNTYYIQYSDDGIGLQKPVEEIKGGMGFRNIESRLSVIKSTYVLHAERPKGIGFTIIVPV